MGLFSNKIKLYNINQIPEFQSSNPYILTGYRAYLSAKQCIISVLILSNEFCNIWSHILGFLYFVYLSVYDQYKAIPERGGQSSDRLVFFVFHTGCQVCMLFSSLYHTFNCHLTFSVMQTFFSLDLLGIIIAILGSYFIGLFYGFYCHHRVLQFYMALCTLVVVVSIPLIMSKKYLSDSATKVRTAHLSSIVLMGFLPIAHWASLVHAHEFNRVFPSICYFYLYIGCAFAFYVSKFPEVCKPGCFDIFGHSHTMWHVLIACSFVYWRNFGLEMLKYRTYDQCLCKDCA